MDPRAKAFISYMDGKTVQSSSIGFDIRAWANLRIEITEVSDAADQVSGRNGNDVIYSFGGADTINGGGGADVLDGGADDDMLTGGVGADIFVFSLAHGEDIITDFRPGEDVIEFQNLDLEWSDLHLVMHQNDTVVSSQEGTITLLGVSISEVTAECFAFG